MASLPEDIITDILLELPVKSISRFKCVSKPWYELLNNPRFIKMHHQHGIQNNKFSVLLRVYREPKFFYYTVYFDVTSSSYHMPIETEYPPFTLHICNIVSTDSLICLNYYYGSIMIRLWNPSTREYKYVPQLNRNRDSICRYGVCYDWKIDDYKLFMIVADTPYSSTSEVLVRRLGSNSWNSIGSIPYNITCYGTTISTKTLNGIIHWIGEKKVIVSFDMVEEQTKEIQIPTCYMGYLWLSGCREVGVLGEDLYLLVYVVRRKIDLWVMKDYGVIDSWTKIFSLSKKAINFDRLTPLHYINENREILLQGSRSESKEDFLITYNLKSGRLVTLDIPCMPKHFHASTSAGSLFSLNSGESGKSLRKYKDVRRCACKYISLTVERAKSGLGRCGWGTYFVFCLVLIGSYLALGRLGP